MRTGVILDGNFINDQRVMNETRILEENGHLVFVLNKPERGSKKHLSYSRSILLIRPFFSKRINNLLFALENIIPLYDLFWYWEIRNLVKKYKIEVLHAHDLYLARAAGWAAKRYGIPLILDLHENYPAAIKEYRWANRPLAKLIVMPSRWKRKEKAYLSFADRIIVLSPNFKKTLISGYPEIDPDSIFIYPNVPDIEKLQSFQINYNLSPGKKGFNLFYFGVISKRRGILTTIETLRTLLPEHPGLHLLLAGPVDKAERKVFRELFKDNSVKDNITYFPWINISEFPSYVSQTDVCLSPITRNPQHDSGLANKVFLYMLFKKPLLVSDCIPQMELVENEKCGLIFRNNDAQDMALKIKKLMSDPEELIRMGERGKKAVLERYNTKIQGETILEVYTKPGLTGSSKNNY